MLIIIEYSCEFLCCHSEACLLRVVLSSDYYYFTTEQCVALQFSWVVFGLAVVVVLVVVTEVDRCSLTNNNSAVEYC